MLYNIRWRSLMEPFIPYRNVAFFVELMQLMRMVQARDPAKLGQVRLIFAIMIVQTIFFLSHAITPNKSPYQQLITFDIFALSKLPTIINAELTLFMISIFNLVYFYFFVAIKNLAVVIFEEVYLKQKFDFILTTDGSSFGRRLWIVMNISQLFTISQNISMIVSYAHVMLALFNYNLNTFYAFIDLLIFHIAFFIFSSWLIILYYFGLIASTTCVGILFIFNGRLAKMSLLIRTTSNRYTLLRLLLYIRLHHHTLTFLLELNKLYGTLLTTYLVTTCPFIATLFVFLLEGGGTSKIMNVLLVVLLASMFSVSIVFHMLAALYTDRLHTPYRRIMTLNMRLGKRCPLRSRLYLAKNIQALHVKHKYGITYASFGLVSMAAFCKFLFLFFEGLIYNFKMVHHI